MAPPRLLLVPNFSELEWVIKPRLGEWAEVASYDPPGIGDEPISGEDRRRVLDRGGMRELVARRGLEKLDQLGWERCFIAADGEGNGAAALIAAERPDAVRGIALGHACLDYGMDGERPAVSPQVWAAMRELIENDRDGFVRSGIVQVTGGSYAEELAERIADRFDSEIGIALWEALRSEPVEIGALLEKVGAPLLFAKHEGCLVLTDEGFEDAARAFPDARVYRLPEPPVISEAFAGALRTFCAAV